MEKVTHLALATGLKTFFRLLYHEFAWTYDAVAWAVSFGDWNNWVRSALPYLPGPRVLELGIGPGHLQAALLDRGVQAFGLDASQQMARQAARRLAGTGREAKIIRSLAQSLPFAGARFDQAAATFPTNYIFDPSTLSEIRRVLKPAGLLVVIPAGWISGDAPTRRLLRSIYQATGQSPSAPTDEMMEKLRGPFRQAGFEVEVKIIQQDTAHLIIILARKPIIDGGNDLMFPDTRPREAPAE